jgi:diguanylate cyclase (GGDEF)-like protein
MASQPSGWALRQLPRGARFLYVAVVSVYAAALAAGAVSPLRWRDVLTAAVLVGAAVGSIEVTHRFAWPRNPQRRLSSDFLGVWMLPAALLVPPAIAAIAIALPVLYIQLRGARRSWLKLAYTIAALGLTQMAASETHLLLTHHHGTWTFAQLGGGAAQLAAVLATIAVRWLVNLVLTGGIVALTASSDAVRAVLRDVDGLVIDAVDLCTGVLVAMVWVADPMLVLFAVPPVLLMQHYVFSALRQVVRTDLLTEVASGAYWRDVASRELQRAETAGSEVSLLVVDLDEFKTVNDRYGHLAGDALLSAVARALTDAVRPRDLVGRLGGEEFAVLLGGLSLLDAARAAQRVREQVAGVRVRDNDGRWISVTASIGVATAGLHGRRLEDVLAAADQAMYAAKAAGRNCVRVSHSLHSRVIDLTTADVEVRR